MPIESLPARIWRHDTTAFTSQPSSDDVHGKIKDRLGWLAAPAAMTSHVPEIETLANDLRREGVDSVYLLGMGGSSLCAEVLRDVPMPRTQGLRLTVLDTTDEHAVKRATDGLVPERAVFLVASKSGSTVEVTSLERHFWSVVAASIPNPGRHFAAITDPETSLVAHAAARGYRKTFINPPDIGGRYSVLSLFGLVPAALLGLDVSALLESGRGMARLCRSDETSNPGLALGQFMGEHAKSGRDKLTVLTPPELAVLGVWIEQLVAESTGKAGKGTLPIVGEPVGRIDEYGHDRAFVAVMTRAADDVGHVADALEAAGHPVFRIRMDMRDLGGEFFRWEFGTAVAGVALGVNPFDEPNVRSAKVSTQRQLDYWKANGSFHVDPPLIDEGGESGVRRRRSGATGAIAPTNGDYVALLDYLPAGRVPPAVLEGMRADIRRRLKVATTHGIGPRYLHSTGQYHKGGPNTGVFLLLTGADATMTAVPGADYSFSVLKQAQALGDFDALVAMGRRVIHYHFDDPRADLTGALVKMAQALG